MTFPNHDKASRTRTGKASALIVGAVAGATIFAAQAGQAATVNLTTTNDGYIHGTPTTGASSVNTTSGVVAIANNGTSTIRKGVFEFDLSSIDDGATINSVSFNWVNVSQHVYFQAAVDLSLYTYLGDGAVTLADWSGGDLAYTTNQAPMGIGDMASYTLTDISDVAAALAGNRLTIRFEQAASTEGPDVASLENNHIAGYAPAHLIIDYDLPGQPPVGAVPLPAGGVALLTGLAALLGLKRRRTA